MYYPVNIAVGKLWDHLFDLTSIEVLSRALMKLISLKYLYRNCIALDAYSEPGNGEWCTPVARETRRMIRGVLCVISFFNQMCPLLFSCGEVWSRGSAVLYHVPHSFMNSVARSCG